MSAERLAELIRTRQPCVVLTGAGVSTESGIPDFRSPTGIWAEVDPMEYASLRAFQSDAEKVWSFYAPRVEMLTGAEPNAAHHALAELEHRGFVQAIVTQNIDLLHTRAGSREVVEVHGSIRTASCLSCGHRQPLDESLLPVPRCPECGAVLKPDVVFFGGAVSERTLAAAWDLFAQAEALLVIGSSLAVYSGFRFVRRAQEEGLPVAVVNIGSTRADDIATVKLSAPVGTLLPRLVAALGVRS